MRKTAFFDMDGTLVAPLFHHDGRTTCGFPPEKWIEFCDKRRQTAYNDCVVVKPVIDFARKLLHEGYDTKILTVCLSEGEREGKLTYAKRENWYDPALGRYLTLFSDMIFVGSDEEKIRYINDYVLAHGLSPADCLLVEDNINNMFVATDMGLKCAHVSHIMAGIAPV